MGSNPTSSARFLITCLILLSFYIISASTASADSPTYTYVEGITQAISNSETPSPDWLAAASTIVKIPDSGGTFGLKYDSEGDLIVRTAAKSWQYASNYVDQANYTTYYDSANPHNNASWVTTGNDFTNFRDTNGAAVTGSDLVKLIERGLGMNNKGNHDVIVEYAVSPGNNTIMRPAKNPDITTYNPTQYGDSNTTYPFKKPADMTDDVYNNFVTYYEYWKSTIYPTPPAAPTTSDFPWTQLAYSYFWGKGTYGSLTISDIQGMTEFIILENTPVRIYGIYATQSYIYTKNNGQYGNGYATFNIDGACDSVWAGNRFQKNVSRSTSSPSQINVTGSGSVSGGQGILVWSPNYAITVDSGCTVTTDGVTDKFGIANTANIAILFEGDTSADYGTPVTSGINKVTNSGTITGNASNTGTAIKIEDGDTTIINNAGGVISGTTAVAVNGGTTTITNSGTITGDITLDGTAALDLGHATLTFDGDYTQGSDSTLKATVNSAADFGKLSTDTGAATGTATLAGTLKTTTVGTYAVGITLNNFMVTNGVSGAFGIFDTPITPTIVWNTKANGNNLDLVATRDYNNYPLRRDLTDNQKNVAALMQSVLPSAAGDLSTVKSAIDGLSTNAQVADAYSQASPERFSGISTIVFTGATMQFDNLQNHLQELRTGVVRGMAFDNFTGSFAGNLFKEDRVLIAYDGDDWAKFARESSAHASTDKKSGFFINGEGNFGSQDATANQPGFDYSSGAVTSGFDFKLIEGLIAGLNIGYARVGSKLGGAGGNIDADSVSYGVYGTYSWQNLYLDLTGQLASNFYHTNRKITFGGLNRSAKASPFGQQWSVASGAGCDFHIKDLVTGPVITLKYSGLWIDSFSEEGADSLDLDVNSQDAKSCQLGLGWRAEYELKAGQYSFFPEAHISFQQEFLNDSRSIGASLAGTAFDIVTDDPSRNFMLAGCSLAFRFTNSVLLNVGYQIQALQHGYVAHNLNGSVKAYF